jgi:hypothetical protein
MNVRMNKNENRIQMENDPENKIDMIQKKNERQNE